MAIGTGEGSYKISGAFSFAYCDVFTFAGDKIRPVESYLVPLPAESGD